MYHRLTDLELQKLTSLTSSGSSLNKISKELKLRKTTVYYHFRKIRGRTYQKPIFKFESDKLLGEIIGIFAGDGSSYFSKQNYHYQIRIHFGIRNSVYTDYVKLLFEKSFGKNFLRKKDGPDKEVLQILSKDVRLFFHKFLIFDDKDKSHSVKIKDSYINNREFMLGFIKGIFGTDGTISGRKTAFYTSSEILKNQIVNFLEENKIKNSTYPDNRTKLPVYQIYIWKENVNRFNGLIIPFN